MDTIVNPVTIVTKDAVLASGPYERGDAIYVADGT